MLPQTPPSRVFLALIFVWPLLCLCAPQAAAQEIRVKVLDGRNGKPTLHVTGRNQFDPAPAIFRNSNIGGATSVPFMAHIDTSFAYNPVGALIHLFRDLLHIGGPRNPCL